MTKITKRRRFELRLSESHYLALKRTADENGYRSMGAYVEGLIKKDLFSGAAQQNDQGQAIIASFDRLSKDIRVLHTAQQALFATVDSLTRLFLTCIPEPPPERLDVAKRRARLRYDRFLLSVAQNMTSDARATLTELTSS